MEAKTLTKLPKPDWIRVKDRKLIFGKINIEGKKTSTSMSFG